MLIASIDIETTGLDPSWCQVLEVGIVLWETTDFVTPVDQLPSFHCYVVHDQIRGEPKALAMNARILDRIADRSGDFLYLTPGQVAGVVGQFLKDHAPGITELSPTGFNFDGFDRQFLRRLANFRKLLTHRSLIPASLFFDPMIDTKLPGSNEVFRRAGVVVAPEDRHTALGDARATIEVLRAGYKRRGGDGVAVPATPRCPECGDRKTVRVHIGFDGWQDEPCPACQTIATAWGVIHSEN